MEILSPKSIFPLSKAKPIDIEFNNITYTVNKGKKIILHGISGCFQSGELTAIMGPSGAGKTTLLNLLTGFLSNGMDGNGEIKTNGVKRNLKEFRKSSCYILQTDQLYPCFTVKEVLNIAASLKLGPRMSKKSRSLAVENVIESLGLESCQKTTAINLSGGQQKRLSIALELLDNPPVMFLDEPTTGLDSSSSLSCIEILSKLARGGRTVVCTLHQPSAKMFETIDHVYVMSNGKSIYQGDSLNVVTFLSHANLICPKYHNPADFLLEVASGELGDKTEDLNIISSSKKWRRIVSKPVTFKRENNENLLMRVQKQGVSEWSKFCVLLYRTSLVHTRNMTTTRMKLFFHAFVGILLGLLYGGMGQDGKRAISNTGFFLVSLVYLAYTSMMPAVLAFPSEMYVLRKERFNNWYSLRTYYAAFNIVDTPIQVLFCATYVVFSYYLSSQVLEVSRFLQFFVACFLVSLFAESLGLLLGAFLSEVNGTFIGATSTALWILLTGFLLLYNHTPKYLRYLHYLSYLKYGFEAVTISQYGFNRETLNCPEGEYCHLKYPKKLLEEFSLSDRNYWSDILVLFIGILIIRMLAYWGLRRRLNTLAC